MGMPRTWKVPALACAASVLVACLPPPAFPDAGGKAGGEEKVESRPVQVKLVDRTLLTQDGKPVRFRTDVVGDRIVVIDTFFTTCGLICPILGAILMELQEKVGDRLGGEVALVSISVDPGTDIPPRLKAYAEQWEARPGWIFLTGGKPDVDQVLSGLGLYAANFAEHPSTFLVGDGKTGEWTRFYGFATPEQLMEKVTELTGKRKAGGKAS
ncbi:MAG: SCO family protein [Deltaproteobacteria bacterium]|nr:SCO family protein [Deltaproteobacteria bacterium]